MLYAAHVTVGLGGPGHGDLWNKWFYEAIELSAAIICLCRARVGSDRRAWAAIGVAMVLNCLGDMYTDHVLAGMVNPPYPSWADAAYLASYPPLYVGVMLLIRARAPRLPSSTWLEGVVGALALASVAATFAFDPAVASTHGDTAEVAVNLAYPTLDVLLLALVGAGFALQGQRAGRAWVLLAAGIALVGAADVVYLVQVANGTYSLNSWVNAAWPLAAVIIALAAWTDDSPRPAADSRPRGWAVHLQTGVFALLIVGVLAVEGFRRVPLVAHVLLTLAVVSLIARMAVAGRERRQLARTTAQANTDELTGLANRRRLYAAADLALADERPAVLLLLDLNRFKELNDTLGHNIGDVALCQLAERLQSVLPPNGLLARIGGDEFVALLPGNYEEAAALAVAQSFQDALEEPFQLGEFMIPMQASIGIALAPAHASTRAELLRCADVAMYRAKSQQTEVEIYKPTADVHTSDRLLLLSELRHAIDTGELALHYQPKVSLTDDRLTGVEALVRWEHPRHGLMQPADFVPLAESQGLIRRLTLDVLDRALGDQRQWRRDGYEIPISVNLSPANLLDARLPADIAAALHTHETPPRTLELEITESMLMHDPDRALDVMARINELEVEFSLDDFGAGYSSLAQLKQLPVRTLKIDRSFIAHMSDSDGDATIVRTIIEMGHQLRLRTVAEGVESDSHMRLLREYGCDSAQGFHLSRPIPAPALAAWLRERRHSRPDAAQLVP